MKKVYFLLISFFVFAMIVNAQEGEAFIQIDEVLGETGNSIYHINMMEDGSKWLSTVGSGLVYMNAENEITNYHSTNSVLEADSIFSTFQDSHGNLWVATFGEGLGLIAPNGDWSFFNTENSEIPSNFVTDIVEDDEGNIWFATLEFMSSLMDGVENGGIVKIDTECYWTHYSKENSPLLTNNTFKLLLDDEQNLWIGTINAASPTEILDDGGGLCKLSKSGDWTVYTTENSGIGANNIMSMAMDEFGNIYVGSLDGYHSRLDTNGEWKSFTAFMQEIIEIITGSEFDPVSILALEIYDNTMYLAFGPSALLCFPPSMFDSAFTTSGFIVLKNVNENYSDYNTMLFDIISSGEISNESEQMAFYVDILESTYPFAYRTIPSIETDESDNLWIGTMGGGLYIFNPDGIEEGFMDDLKVMDTPETEKVDYNCIKSGIHQANDFQTTVYPNPVAQKLNIQLTSELNQTDGYVRLINANGKTVSNQLVRQLGGNNNYLELDVSQYPNGLYWLEIITENQLKSSQKIVVAK